MLLKLKRKYIRYLSLLLAILLCLTGLIFHVYNSSKEDEITSSAWSQSAYDDAIGLTTYNTTIDYFVNSYWLDLPEIIYCNNPFSYSGNNELLAIPGQNVKLIRCFYYDYGKGGTITTGGEYFGGPQIQMRFKNAAYGSDGKNHSIIMTISNIYMTAQEGYNDYEDYTNSITKNTPIFGYQSSQSGFVFVADDHVGVYFDVSVRVEDATNNEKLFMSFIDLDQPGFHGSDNFYFDGTFPSNFVEGVKINTGIVQGPLVPSNRLVTINGNTFQGSGSTNKVYAAGMSYLADAKNGTSFTWAGKHCTTLFGSNTTLFDLFAKVKLYVRTETESGGHTSYEVVNDSMVSKYVGFNYSYTLTKSKFTNFAKSQDWISDTNDADWIFNFSQITETANNVTEDITFYEEVKRNQYTYFFHSNLPTGKTSADVSNMPSSKTVIASTGESGKSDASVSSPTLKGYWFKGWNTASNGTGSGYPGAETMKSNKTFYAQWERATYIVKFDPNGSSNPNHYTGEFTQNTTEGTMADQEIDYDTPTALNANQFTREGYTFIGWNTRADGYGTSYTDMQTVTNLVGYDSESITLYAQWEKKLGTETITVISEETGNPVSDVTLKLYKDVNGTETYVTTATTGSGGSITVDDMHWFNYKWVIEDVPAGYVKSADTDFTINYNKLSAENEVILYMKHVTITLDSRVDCIIKGENAPAFLYHISGKDVAGVRHDYDVLVQTDKSLKYGTNSVTDLFAGEYTVTQVSVSRYKPQTAENVNNSTINDINAIVDVKNHDFAEVLFPYTLTNHGWYYGVDSRVNSLRK